jgi:hypothetical protein
VYDLKKAAFEHGDFGADAPVYRNVSTSYSSSLEADTCWRFLQGLFKCRTFIQPGVGGVLYLDIDCHSPARKWIGGSSLFLHGWMKSDDSASDHLTAKPLRTDIDSEGLLMSNQPLKSV